MLDPGSRLLDPGSFVDRANAMIRDMTRGRDPFRRRHWKLTGDGDLWYHLYLVIKAKGTRAIQISWVKGHATSEHVAHGVTTWANKVGNDAADIAADAGTALHGKDVCDMASWLFQRSAAYCQYMKKISHHIIEAYLIHRTLVERKVEAERATKAGTDRRSAYSALSYGDTSVAFSLDPSCSLANYSSFVKNRPHSIDVQAFLSGLQVSELAQPKARPITWVKLYILYRIRGHACLTALPGSLAYARPNPDKLIRAFKNTVRAVVSRTFIDTPHSALFKPAHAKRDAQIGVGILGFMTAPSFNVVITDVERTHVAKALVLLSRDLSEKHIDAYINGQYKVVPKVLALNGKAGWASTVFKDCCVQTRHCPWPAMPLLGNGAQTSDTGFYQCALCRKVEPNTCRDFQYSDLDVRHKCFHCRKASPVNNWTCCCDLKWFLCPRHCKDPGSCTTSSQQSVVKQQTSSCSSASRKRSHAEASSSDMQEMLEQDLRREHRRAMPRQATVITLSDSAVMPPVRPTMLPLILRRRFNL